MGSPIGARPSWAGRTLGLQIAHRLLRPQRLQRMARTAWRPAALRAIARVRPWRGPALHLLARRAPGPGYGAGPQLGVWRAALASGAQRGLPVAESGLDSWAPGSLATAARAHEPSSLPAATQEPWREALHTAAGPLLPRLPTAPALPGAPTEPAIRARAARLAPIGPQAAGALAPTARGLLAQGGARALPALPAQAGQRPHAALPRLGRPLVEPRPLVAAASHLAPPLHPLLDAPARLRTMAQLPATGTRVRESLLARAAPITQLPAAGARLRESLPARAAPVAQLPTAPPQPVLRALAGELPAAEALEGTAAGAAHRALESAGRVGSAISRLGSGSLGALAARQPLRPSLPTLVRRAQPLAHALAAAPALPAAAASALPGLGPGGLPVQMPWPTPSALLPQGLPPAPGRPSLAEALAGKPTAGVAGALPLARRPQGPLRMRGQQAAGAALVEHLVGPALTQSVQRALGEAVAPAAAGAGEAQQAPAIRADAQEAPAAAAVDLDAVARQVYEILRRRLRIERERSHGRSA